MFTNFFYLLREYGVPIGLQQVMEFYKGLELGLASDIDSLFTFARLVFIKKLEHFDAFERAFAFYFYGIEIPPASKEDLSLLGTKPFQEWLEREISLGNLTWEDFYHNLSKEELIRRFWETVLEQQEAHHGGGRWIGTGGYSPFGHSGISRRGIRLYGASRNRSAIKVIGERRYMNYASSSTLKAENIRQALEPLRNMVPEGPPTVLDVDETIFQTAKRGGDIELIFDRELRDKIRVILLLDNGGVSMLPYVGLTRLLFSKVRDRFRDLRFFYFRNCIYGNVFIDPPRMKKYPTMKLLEESPETRVLIVGDAAMAPEELLYPHGAIEYGVDDKEAGITWLERIRNRFKYSVWLNPIPKDQWETVYGNETISTVRGIFNMEDLTLGGIKNTVEYLNSR